MPDSAQHPDRASRTDEWQWLEKIHGEDALAWVGAQNARTLARFDAHSFENTRRRILEVLNANERIPMVSKHGPYLYNFWQDADHPRGLWRRTTMESYRTPSPEWDVLLDVDELARREGTEFVFAGTNLCFPDFERALVALSPGGGDAAMVRELDLSTREFVSDGFTVPAAKTFFDWIDRDIILISTDFGPGTLTSSSYPRQVRRWRRGEPFASAELLMEVPVDHMGAWGHHEHTVGFERNLVIDRIDFWHARHYLLGGADRALIDVPDDAVIDTFREWLLIKLRSDWEVGGQTFTAGSLLCTRFDSFLAGERRVEALFVPDPHTSLAHFSWTRNHLLLNTLRDVASRVEVLNPGPDGWARLKLGAVQPNQTVDAYGADKDETDDFWLLTGGFLQPTTLQVGSVGSATVEGLKSAPAFFDASGLEVSQHFAISNDGTRIPYFQVSPKDLPLDGRAPTRLYGYGGFEATLTPGYDGAAGRAWLERGGVLVIANIRGGGEYGPAWHQAALRENRPRAYEDFAAVAKDLIARKITSPAHLGCVGGSNGGLLVGNMLTKYPELFGAIVCEVPLLDMKRYTQLSAGASWIAEYGDPDVPKEWAIIQRFSPYHSLREGVAYPPVLFLTATSDDRVGPVQARKMAARMQDRGIPGVYFYENHEGGHSGAADNAQRAHMKAMSYEFLRLHLFPENAINQGVSKSNSGALA